MNTQTIALDVSKATAVPPTIHIRQGDKNGTVLNVGIFDNGTALDLTSLPVRLCAKLPDGAHYYSVNGTADGNTAAFAIDESYAAAYPGVTDVAYVDVLDGDTVICSTQPFRLVVEPGARDGVVPSEQQISEIDAAVERANAAAEACETLANPITDAQIDSIVADTAVTSTNKLTATGLSYFWAKLKTWAAGAFASISHTHTASQVTDLASNAATGVKGSAEASYRTGNVDISAANVGAYTSAETDAAIAASAARAYKAAGSVTFANLPRTLTEVMLGYVYNIEDSFTIDSSVQAIFVEQSGTFPAGTNVVVINTGTDAVPVYKYDVVAGFIDLSGYSHVGHTHTQSAITDTPISVANGGTGATTAAGALTALGAAAASHNHSGDALTPASVAATGAVSGSSISDGVGTLAALRESVSKLNFYGSSEVFFATNGSDSGWLAFKMSNDKWLTLAYNSAGLHLYARQSPLNSTGQTTLFTGH